MILIDYSNILIITLTVELAQMGEKQSPDLARHLFLNNIRNYRKKFKGKYGELVFAVDSKSYWRKQEFPYYKANRKKNRDDSNFDWDFIFYCMDLFKNELINFFPYKVIEVENAEGDDVISSLIEYTSTQLIDVGLVQEPEPVLIISGDRDFIQLQRYKHVQQYSTIEKELIKPSTTAESYLAEHIIKGDKNDGIPNVLSDSDTFVCAEKRQARMTQKRFDNLMREIPEDVKPNWERNKKLIDLSQIPENIKKEIIEKYNNYKVPEASLLYSYFVKNRLAKLIDSISDFK